MQKEDILKFLNDDEILSIIYYEKGAKKVNNVVEIISFKEETNELLLSSMDNKNLLINLENIISLDYNFFSSKN